MSPWPWRVEALLAAFAEEAARQERAMTDIGVGLVGSMGMGGS